MSLHDIQILRANVIIQKATIPAATEVVLGSLRPGPNSSANPGASRYSRTEQRGYLIAFQSIFSGSIA